MQAGFEWIDCSDNRHSVVSFVRWAKDAEEFVIVGLQFHAPAAQSLPHWRARDGILQGNVEQ